jgi:hypothetical protein
VVPLLAEAVVASLPLVALSAQAAPAAAPCAPQAPVQD